MKLFAPMPSRLYVTCPSCHSPHALVTLERASSQSCFCPGCRHLWQMPLTRGPEGKARRKRKGS